MEHLNGLQHTEKPHINQFTLVKPRTHDRTTAYLAALELVQYIDESLSKGSHHYRTKSGRLLRTLDEVIHAILADNLVWEIESTSWDQRSARAA